MVLTDEEQSYSILQIFNYITPAKTVKTWSDYRNSVKNDIINSLINARLEELTQKEKPPFVAGYTGRDQFIRGYEAFVSFAILGDNPTKEAVDALIGETERARKFGFLESELKRVKANMLNEAERAFTEKDKSLSSALVNEYVNNFLEKEPIPGPENHYKFLKQVLPTISLKEVNDEAKKMSAPVNAFALVTAPAGKKSTLPSNAQLENEIVAANKQQVKPYQEKAVADKLVDASLKQGNITAESKNEKLGTTNLTLSNGVTVTIKPTTFKNDEIQMDAWRWGGWQRFPLEDKPNAQYSAQLVSQMGVKDMSPTDLQKFLSGKTVEASPYLNDYEEGIQGSSSVKDFETFLQLVNLYFTAPRKDEGLFNSFVSKQKSMIMFMKANPQVFYIDTLFKIAYNNNPWANPLPKPEDFQKLNIDKVMNIYHQVFDNADGMHFTFVGNLDLQKARPLLQTYLGSLPGAPAEHKYKDNGARLIDGVTEGNIKKGKDPKSMITVIWEGETTYKREEDLAFRALVEVLNIKVIEKLREEMSGMYAGGLNGSIQRRPYVHYNISANIPCGPENVDSLTNALFTLIKTAQEKGVEQKDLDKVKETWRKKYREGLQSNDAWLDNLSQAFINQTNPENILDYGEKVDALTVNDLQNAAKKFFTMNHYVKLVLYPENANVIEGVKKGF
jgi:zinc protease